MGKNKEQEYNLTVRVDIQSLPIFLRQIADQLEEDMEYMEIGDIRGFKVTHFDYTDSAACELGQLYRSK